MFKKLFKGLKAITKQKMQHLSMTTSRSRKSVLTGETEYDPETLHGTHYSVDDFSAEVARRVKYETERRDVTSESEKELAF